MAPTKSKDQKMEILPKQMSPQVEKMIEDEVEKRIQERLLKNEPDAAAKIKLYQEDDQDDEEKKAKILSRTAGKAQASQ